MLDFSHPWAASKSPLLNNVNRDKTKSYKYQSSMGIFHCEKEKSIAFFFSDGNKKMPLLNNVNRDKTKSYKYQSSMGIFHCEKGKSIAFFFSDGNILKTSLLDQYLFVFLKVFLSIRSVWNLKEFKFYLKIRSAKPPPKTVFSRC